MVSIATSTALVSDSDKAKRRVWLAVGLIAVAALAAVRLPVRTITELARGGVREQAGDHERLRQLNQLLPAPVTETGRPAAWIWLIAAVLLPCWGAHSIICALSRGLPATRQIRALRLALTLGTGLGLSSVTYFLWLLMFGQPQQMFLFADTLFWCLVVFVCSPGDHETTLLQITLPPRDLAQPQISLSRPTACLFAILCLVALAGLAGQALASPDGGWDARAIWNLRARFLFRSGDDWHGAFAGQFDHTDYPLLVPAALARYWTFLGNDPAWPGACLGIAFTIATVALLVTAIGAERRGSLGLLAGMVLLGTVRLLRWGALQYADVPLAFFMLATIWLLMYHDEQQSARDGHVCSGLLSLAGLMMGLAAWTKNEGLLFACVVLVTHSGIRALQLGWKQSWREDRHMLAGALPLLLVLLLFKSQVSATNDLVASQGLAETSSKLLDPIRHLTILEAFMSAGFQVANAFALVVPLCFVLLGRRPHTNLNRDRENEIAPSLAHRGLRPEILAVAEFARIQTTGNGLNSGESSYVEICRELLPHPKRVDIAPDGGRHGAAFVAAVLGLMLCAYYFAYLTTPYELQWHLSTSVDRLLIQLWPAAVLAIFRLLRSPEEAWPAAPQRAGFQAFPAPNAPHAFGTPTRSARVRMQIPHSR